MARARGLAMRMHAAIGAVAIASALAPADAPAEQPKKSTKPTARSKDHGSAERELLAMSELAESVGEIDNAIGHLDELRKLCRSRDPPCETPDPEILERLSWLCLKSRACVPRREALLAEVRQRLPENRELIRDLGINLSGADDERPTDDPGSEIRIQQLRSFLRSHPNDAGARLDLANALSDSGAYREAANELAVYLEARPSDLEARRTLIDALLQTGQKIRAVDELTIYVKQRPEDAEARADLIDTLIDLDRREAAFDEITLYLHKRPRAWRIRWREIELLEALKRTQELDRAIERLVRDDPKSAVTWAFVAARALQKDDPDRAESAVAHAKTLTSTDAETLQRIRDVERDLKKTRAQERSEFRQDAQRSDFEDDLRYGGEPQ